MPSIAACYNVYNDALSLRGSLELAASYFDEIFVIHSGPGGRLSDDGTIELCEQFGCKQANASLDDGYGVIRSRLIHECGCAWAFIMDADERFYAAQPMLHCKGTDRYPMVQEPDLEVIKDANLIYPGYWLKESIKSPSIDAIKTIRRHWFDYSMRRPCENWETQKDWQLRIVRNAPHIGYQHDRKMHEHLINHDTGTTPSHRTACSKGGPFHDHFHMFYRRTIPGKKEANEANYARLERGEPTTI